MTASNLQKILIFSVAAAAFWLLSRYLLPIFLPFLLAMLLALAAEPLVEALSGKLHLPRSLASGLGIGIALMTAVVLLLSLCALALRQLRTLSGILPDLSASAVAGLQSLEGFLLSLTDKTPDGIRTVLHTSVENLFSDSTSIVNKGMDAALSLASGILKNIPDSALGFGTWILASFMVSAKLPGIKAAIGKRIPESWRAEYPSRLRLLRHNITGWLGAQIKLTGVTFLVLTLGLWLLRIPYALLWAGLISLVDALPILGSGTVLIPWSLICFLQADTPRALGLLGIYGTAALLRTVLEPRLVGKQLGLDPLITLIAMYTGYRLWGIFGMLLSPLLAVTLTQLATAPNPENT